MKRERKRNQNTTVPERRRALMTPDPARSGAVVGTAQMLVPSQEEVSLEAQLELPHPRAPGRVGGVAEDGSTHAIAQASMPRFEQSSLAPRVGCGADYGNRISRCALKAKTSASKLHVTGQLTVRRNAVCHRPKRRTYTRIPSSNTP